jgi:DNA-binding MarR family transcriptional regulator
VVGGTPATTRETRVLLWNWRFQFAGFLQNNVKTQLNRNMASENPARNKVGGRAATENLAADDPGRRRLPSLLRRCWFNLNQTFRRRIAHTGITPDQFTVMRTLLEGDAKGMTQRELTDLMSSDPNTIASLLERMETMGLVERKAHERDRRAYRINLKPLGKRKYDEVREIALTLQMEILSVLPTEKQEEFLKHLGLVADASRLAAEKIGK